MKKIIAVFISLLMLHNVSALAATSLVPIKLTKGVSFVPPQDGWYFNTDAEKFMRGRLVEADYFEKTFTISQDTNKHLEESLKLEQDIADRYKKAWSDAETSLTNVLKSEGRSKFWYIFLGGAIVVASAFAVGFTAKALNK
jgi:uncharacterized protein YcnI